MVVLKEQIFNMFYFGEGVVGLKELILTFSTLVGYGRHERTDFLISTNFGGMVVLKELICNGFYFGSLWCP